jgi:hypothetical protein
MAENRGIGKKQLYRVNATRIDNSKMSGMLTEKIASQMSVSVKVTFRSNVS